MNKWKLILKIIMDVRIRKHVLFSCLILILIMFLVQNSQEKADVDVDMEPSVPNEEDFIPEIHEIIVEEVDETKVFLHNVSPSEENLDEHNIESVLVDRGSPHASVVFAENSIVVAENSVVEAEAPKKDAEVDTSDLFCSNSYADWKYDYSSKWSSYYNSKGSWNNSWYNGSEWYHQKWDWSDKKSGDLDKVRL